MNIELFEESKELYNCIESIDSLIETFEGIFEFYYDNDGFRPIILNSKISKDLIEKLKELKNKYEKEFEELE